VSISLQGSDGRAVPKTQLGSTFGAKWGGIFTQSFSRLTPILAQGHYDARGGGFSGSFLPSPKDLFEIERPGIYTMEIKMQMFRNVLPRDPETLRTNLLVFMGIKIKVEKPAEAKK
jgi:hypothetical protein